MPGKIGTELNGREALLEASLRIEGRTWLTRPYWSQGQPGFAARLRRCPALGAERPTRPTPLAYAARGNPIAVWNIPQSPSRKSGPTPQRAQESSRSEGRHAERPGERITRRIARYGATRKGTDVCLTIDPKDGVRGRQPGGKVGCSMLHTSHLVTSWIGMPLTGSESIGALRT